MRTKMNVVAAVFLPKDIAIPRHQDRNGIRQQQHSCGNGSSPAISPRMPHAGVFEIDRVHEVVQGDVRIASAHASEQRGEQAKKRANRITPKGAEKQVEPNHIRLQLPEHLQKMKNGSRIIERPAANDGKTLQFRFIGRDLIGKNRHTQESIAEQFLGNMQAIFAQSTLAGWKSGYEANFHSLSGLRMCDSYSMLWLPKMLAR